MMNIREGYTHIHIEERTWLVFCSYRAINIDLIAVSGKAGLSQKYNKPNRRRSNQTIKSARERTITRGETVGCRQTDHRNYDDVPCCCCCCRCRCCGCGDLHLCLYIAVGRARTHTQRSIQKRTRACVVRL